MQENGQAPAEIPEDVALTSLGTTVTNNHQSSNDKLRFPRADLHTITTLGKTETSQDEVCSGGGITGGVGLKADWLPECFLICHSPTQNLSLANDGVVPSV